MADGVFHRDDLRLESITMGAGPVQTKTPPEGSCAHPEKEGSMRLADGAELTLRHASLAPLIAFNLPDRVTAHVEM